MGIKRWAIRLGVAGFLYVALCFSLAVGSQWLTPSCADWTGTADIAVVLGGGTDREGALVRGSRARVDSGVALYLNGQVSQIHMTGGGPLRVHRISIGNAMKARAVKAGVPSEAITVEDTSLSTLQNALFSKPYLPEDAELMILTEGYHSLRGGASFLWAGRPGPICAASQAYFGQRLMVSIRRETAAWGLNILRGSVWLVADKIGLAQSLPDGFLD